MLRSLEASRRAVTALAYARSGDAVVALDSEGTLRVWDTRTGKIRSQIKAHQRAGWSVVF